MKVHRFVVGLAAALAGAGSAHAAFVGWDMRVDADATAAAQAIWTGVLADATVYRMYGVFNEAGQVLLSVSNANFNVSSGTLYQEPPPVGGDTAPIPGFFGPFLGTHLYDSFVTINELTSVATAVLVDSDFAWSSTGVAAGGWFNSNPANQQGTAQFNAATGLYVTLVGQFTVLGMDGTRNLPGPTTNADGAWFGMASVTWNTGEGSETFHAFDQGFIPAPGSMGLLALAGLAAMRRRR